MLEIRQLLAHQYMAKRQNSSVSSESMILLENFDPFVLKARHEDLGKNYMAEQHTVQPEILAVITIGSLAPNDVLNPIGGLKLVVWYSIAICTCTRQKTRRILIWQLSAYRQTAKFNSPVFTPEQLAWIERLIATHTSAPNAAVTGVLSSSSTSQYPRYHKVLHGVLNICNVWLSLKTLCSKVLESFVYQNSSHHFHAHKESRLVSSALRISITVVIPAVHSLKIQEFRTCVHTIVQILTAYFLCFPQAVSYLHFASRLPNNHQQLDKLFYFLPVQVLLPEVTRTQCYGCVSTLLFNAAIWSAPL